MEERSESNALTCSAEFCQSLPPSSKKMMAFVRRREWLEGYAPSCPECGNGCQQQLVDHIFSTTAKWECRLCNQQYEYEPNDQPCRSPLNKQVGTNDQGQTRREKGHE